MKISEDERIRLEAFRYLYQEIEKDILEDNDPSWFFEPKYKDRPERERGARAALRLIMHRIDCIID